MRLFQCIVALSLTAFGNLFGQTSEERLKTYFSALHENQGFNGNVLVAENGKIVFEQSYGYADFATKNKNYSAIQFPIASISKTIVASAVLKLVELGKIKVADPVTNHLPKFPYPEITIRHLLSHTSGLPPYNAYFDSLWKANPNKVFTNADFLPGVVSNRKALLYQPGERGNYDNINYIVLALLIEKVASVSFPEFVNKYILIPAGMNHTSFFPLKAQYEQNQNHQFAFPHLFPHMYSDSLVKANTVPYIRSYWGAYNFNGFGDFISTTHDLLKFSEEYANGGLLNNAIMNEAFTPVKLNNGNNNPGNFGFGWEIDKDSLFGKVVYHSGAATGFSAVLLRNLPRKQTIILFDNTHSNASQVAKNALKVLNGIRVDPKKSLAKMYAKTLLSNGPIGARTTLFELKNDTTNYYISEDEMNLIGYDFLGGVNNPNPFRFPEEHLYKEAVETFKLNAELFPNSWNVFDSYGEALVVIGEKAKAIEMYKKSILLNPNNEAGKKILAELLK
ncbi:MAG: beta-lactamase family protein [Chitinophagaceae bacterium]|nr:beta-lactamase family protein [Chitinophagaceae bacterium]